MELEEKFKKASEEIAKILDKYEIWIAGELFPVIPAKLDAIESRNLYHNISPMAIAIHIKNTNLALFDILNSINKQGIAQKTENKIEEDVARIYR